MNGKSIIVPALVIAIGLGCAGYFAGEGFRKSRAPERFVTVKGVSEREIVADTAIWSVTLVSASNDLAEARQQLTRSHEQTKALVKEHNIDPGLLNTLSFEVIDRDAQQWQSGDAPNRYILRQTVAVRSDDPPAIMALSQDMSKLLDAGVVFDTYSGPYPGPTYLFTQLDAYKPEMLAEATRNARTAAEQFAADSGAQIGGIRRASQGLFQIQPRTPAPGVMEESQNEKILRVVSTFEFYLAD